MFEADSEFTPVPFWFWNDDLKETEIKRQMTEMKDKGVDAFVIHPRLGLTDNIGYLTKEYFHFVRYAVELAGKMDMKVVLYDEAMYPSGSCHGEVVKKNPGFASKGLMCSKAPVIDEDAELIAEDDAGKLYYYMVPSGGTIRGVFPGEDDGEKNAPKSTDLLNKDAVRSFIELTHEKYFNELREYFGNTIIAFFTDEPNILGRNAQGGLIAWSDGVYDEFLKAGGNASSLRFLFDKEAAGEDADKARRIYENIIYHRMSENYYGQLSEWCSLHNISLMGHPEKSTDIGYLKKFQIPCQDVVWRMVAPENELYITGENSCMAKCSSDSARHRGRLRNGNEAFGCCGRPDDPYKFTEGDMKWYLNWLFVRGVNLIVPHAFYYSVDGERGAERPPEVGLNNPLWPDYRRMSDYIKRMCGLITGAVNEAGIAVLCTHNRLSYEIARPLFEHQTEFNYLEEELLPECILEDGILKIGKQEYKLVVYDEEFLRSAGEEALKFISSENGVKKLYFKKEDPDGLIKLTESMKLSDVRISGEGRELLRTSLIRKEGGEFLIISNEGYSEEPEKEECRFFELNVAGRKIRKVFDVYRNTCDLDNPSGVEKTSIGLHNNELKVIML